MDEVSDGAGKADKKSGSRMASRNVPLSTVQVLTVIHTDHHSKSIKQEAAAG
jgi:hypothetical protein